MEKVKCFIVTVNLFLIIGIVGGIEHDTIGLMSGFIIALALIAINFTILATIKNN